jgi:hypothetical protein
VIGNVASVLALASGLDVSQSVTGSVLASAWTGFGGDHATCLMDCEAFSKKLKISEVR